MTIISAPDALSLSGNLKKFSLVGVSDPISFSISTGGNLISQNIFSPDSSGNVSFDIKDLVEPYLSPTYQDSMVPYEQTNYKDFSYSFNSGAAATIRILRAGIDSFADSAVNFLAANFLTWQLQTKHVTYYTPESLSYYAQENIIIKCRVYYSDGSNSILTVASLAGNKCWTIPVSYSIILALTESEDLFGAYDIWIEDTSGNRLSYIQRYIADSVASEDETWILFENSLGGFDTFRASGKIELSGTHSHNIAEVDGISEDYRVDTERVFRKSTGYLDMRSRTWILDFFPAQKKWVFVSGVLRSIVLTEDNVSYSLDNLPAEYTFNYKYADAKPYLNLSRTESLPDVLNIVTPDLQSFSLPPRLVELSHRIISEGDLLPVQNPRSDEWGAVTFSAILDFVCNRLGISPGGTIGHEHRNLSLLERLDMDNDDQNYLYALRSRMVNGILETLREKIKAGYADNAGKWDDKVFSDYIDQALRSTDIVTFSKVITRILQSPDFISGMFNGSGWKVDENGNAEMSSLTLRSFLKVPQLIYNKIRVTGGEMWNTEGGNIKSVVADEGSDTAFILTMDVEDGDFIELAEDDICKGIFNSSGGFISSYFRVTYVDQAAKTMRIVLGSPASVPGGVNHAPVAAMNICRYGNFTNPDRQQSQYFSSAEQRIVLLGGVDTYIIVDHNYKTVIGKLPDALYPAGYPRTGEMSVYIDGVFARNFYQLDPNGVIVKTIRDRGLWSAETAVSEPYLSNDSFQDDVYCDSCKYRCLVKGTTERPRYDSTDWLLIAGDTTLELIIDSSNGVTFLSGALDTTLTAYVKRGVTDITSSIANADWSWTRETGDVLADNTWNMAHAYSGNSIHITSSDLSTTSGRFVCTAYIRDGAISLQETIDF